ncbi:MAG: hypothetical protein IJV00_04355 [Clostridia bacterium]|nr:hypothetical protein [Clostridia bacterium]
MNPDLRPDLPVMLSTLTEDNRASYLEEFISLGCRRLWLCPERELLFDADADLSGIKSHIDFFRANGFETGLWINAFGFGGPAVKDVPWQRIVSSVGVDRPRNDEFCPADPGFAHAMATLVARLAALSPQLIMLDDDLCVSVRPGIGCFCPRHLEMMSDFLGEKLSLSDSLPSLLFTGKPGRYRSAWYKSVGDSMRSFCRLMREAVDSVDPSIRLGFCAGYTSWTCEGADPIELSRILAGTTEPFFRFTSAPYWVADWYHRFPSQGFNSVIENARMQAAWSKDSGIEVFGEDDSYPRPAYHVDASFVELFDAGLRTTGVRSLKYMLDYFSPLGYETKYSEEHKKDAALLEAIGAAFDKKTPSGVRLYCANKGLDKRTLPDKFTSEKNVMRDYFSVAAAFFTGLGIPVSYDGDVSVSALFGEDAEDFVFSEDVKKLILDLPAAKKLSSLGYDVGLDSVLSAPIPDREYFGELPLRLSVTGKGAVKSASEGFYDVKTKPGAVILSEFSASNKRFPSAYSCSDGKREYLVFCFDAAAMGELSTVFLSYARAEQIFDFAPVFPYIPKTHGLYQIFSSGLDSRAVLIENLSHDRFSSLEIVLPEKARSVALCGLSGSLSEDGKKIRLAGTFYPREAVLIEYKV